MFVFCVNLHLKCVIRQHIYLGFVSESIYAGIFRFDSFNGKESVNGSHFSVVSFAVSVSNCAIEANESDTYRCQASSLRPQNNFICIWRWCRRVLAWKSIPFHGSYIIHYFMQTYSTHERSILYELKCAILFKKRLYSMLVADGKTICHSIWATSMFKWARMPVASWFLM